MGTLEWRHLPPQLQYLPSHHPILLPYSTSVYGYMNSIQSHLLQLVDLHTDLRDGSLLLSLVAKLTKKQITSPDYDSFPISHSQCLENVQLALSKFKDNGLRLVHDSKCESIIVNCLWICFTVIILQLQLLRNWWMGISASPLSFVKV